MLTAYLESAYVELQLLIEVGRQHVELREEGVNFESQARGLLVEVGVGRT
jgi:hypothetical protein